MLSQHKYLFLRKLNPKRLKFYYSTYNINFKNYYKSIFGNLKTISKFCKQNGKAVKKLQNFLSFVEFKLDQILLKVGFFTNVNVIENLIKSRCIHVNKNVVLKPKYNLSVHDVVYLCYSAFNLSYKMSNLKKLIWLQWNFVNKKYLRNKLNLSAKKNIFPAKHLYKYILVNYKYYFLILLSPLYTTNSLLFNKITKYELNNFYLSK